MKNKAIALIMNYDNVQYVSRQLAVDLNISCRQAFDLVIDLNNNGFIKRDIVDASTLEPNGQQLLFGRFRD